MSEKFLSKGWARALLAVGACALLVSSCMAPRWLQQWKLKQQQERAMAMWQARCTKAGEFIHKTVENVDGIYLVNLRTEVNNNHGDRPEGQFRLSDPYGNDSTGDAYILNFIRGYYHQRPSTAAPVPGVPPRIGFSYVEAIDPKDGKLYRFTGRVDQPWLRDKNYGEWVRDFVLDRTAIAKRTARYGVKFEDISTREEREYWIAGSSLKVIDLTTEEVLAERVGYMVDMQQGSRAGGRSPWLSAANHACPSFDRGLSSRIRQPAWTAQSGQTLDFVEKNLKTVHREP